MGCFGCRRSRKPRGHPSIDQATNEWRRLEARICGIVTRTPPDNPFDSSPMVVVDAYLDGDSVKVIIHSSSIQYATKLRKIIKMSGVLNGGKVEFMVEKPKPLGKQSLRNVPKGNELISAAPLPKDHATTASGVSIELQTLNTRPESYRNKLPSSAGSDIMQTLPTTPESCRGELPDSAGFGILLMSFIRHRRPSQKSYAP